MRRRGRSLEPRSGPPKLVSAPIPRGTSVDGRPARRMSNGSEDPGFLTSDDELASTTSSYRKRRKLKKLFKRKKKKKKKGEESSLSSASRASKKILPFKKRGSRDGSTTGDFYGASLASVNDIEILAQKKGRNSKEERFKVIPDTDYPNTYLSRDELRTEMNHKSAYYHDMRVPNEKGKEIGQLRLEILQCFGLPAMSVIREVSAYVIAVCGTHAFKTDIMPSVPNPMWLSRMRRACMFPIFHAYDKVYIGAFDDHAQAEGGTHSDFIGRVVIDIARLRAGCMYDITLPLRQSAHVFTRSQQGAIRIRMHLIWVSERSAVLSYLPRQKPTFGIDNSQKINCLDERSFRNVAYLVHGVHMPGKFSMTLLKATIREFNFNRIHIFRYLRRQEIYNLCYWVHPFISGFIFFAWMHSVYADTFRYVPGHILTVFVLRLYLNYVHYAMDSPLQNGFTSPTVEELFGALLYGMKGRRKKYIKALNMQTDETNVINPEKHMQGEIGYEGNRGTEDVQLTDIADAMRKSLRVRSHKYRLRTYKNSFTGTEAVDFLTNFGFAYSRLEAVHLGQRLANELKVFEHVTRKEDFEDKPHFYHFLNYDNKKYLITGHRSRFKTLFNSIGFSNRGVNEREYHVEFPFATGKDHPRFTVKQALVIRSAEAKRLLKEKEEAHDIVDCAEFGVVPAPLNPEEDLNMLNPVNALTSGYRKASMAATATMNATVHLPQTVMNLPQNFNQAMRRNTMEFGDPEELYGRLKGRQNPSLDAILESKILSNAYNPYDDDSDDDVEHIHKKRRRGVVFEEKLLRKPPNQDFSRKKESVDRSFAKSMQDTRRKMHGTLLHLFNDQVYNIDQSLFPAKHPEEPQPLDSRSVSSKSKWGKRFGGRGDLTVDERDKKKDKKKDKDHRTPYEAEVDEYDRLLQINKYSHTNPWVNRIAVMIQPIVETIQAPLLLTRGLFNIMTWQDPILSFWLAISAPFFILILHFMPYRTVFGIMGVYFFGPQNWLYRIFQEAKPGYKPPDYDRIVRKKAARKNDSYSESQLFSSQAPGNRHIKFKNVDPKQVKQVVVPSGMLKYNRFYDWPPEPEYARVYQSPPPKNLPRSTTKKYNGIEDDSDGSLGGYESSDSYWYDASLARKKQKKKRKGLKKVGHQVKKGATAVTDATLQAGGAVVGATVGLGGAVVGTTVGATMGIVKGKWFSSCESSGKTIKPYLMSFFFS